MLWIPFNRPQIPSQLLASCSQINLQRPRELCTVCIYGNYCVGVLCISNASLCCMYDLTSTRNLHQKISCGNEGKNSHNWENVWSNTSFSKGPKVLTSIFYSFWDNICDFVCLLLSMFASFFTGNLLVFVIIFREICLLLSTYVCVWNIKVQYETNFKIPIQTRSSGKN
jgi:hypothetical protein